MPSYFSNEVINILESMLKQKANERITITNILKHAWINGEKLSIKEDEDNNVKTIKRKSSSLTILERVPYFPRERTFIRTFTNFNSN